MMLDDQLPVIRTQPARRRYARPVPAGPASRYVRARRKQSRSVFARLLWLWLTSAVVGLAGGYAVTFYGFGRDPLGLAPYLPVVSVEWPAKAAP